MNQSKYNKFNGEIDRFIDENNFRCKGVVEKVESDEADDFLINGRFSILLNSERTMERFVEKCNEFVMIHLRSDVMVCWSIQGATLMIEYCSGRILKDFILFSSRMEKVLLEHPLLSQEDEEVMEIYKDYKNVQRLASSTINDGYELIRGGGLQVLEGLEVMKYAKTLNEKFALMTDALSKVTRKTFWDAYCISIDAEEVLEDKSLSFLIKNFCSV